MMFMRPSFSFALVDMAQLPYMRPKYADDIQRACSIMFPYPQKVRLTKLVAILRPAPYDSHDIVLQARFG